MGRKAPMAAIAAAAAAAVAGCGSTRITTDSSTITETDTTTQTVTVARKAAPPAKTVTITHTAAASTTHVSAPAASGGASFSGNGGKNIGTITVANDSTLSWTNEGDIFQILDPQEGLIINSQAHSGTSAVSAGTYHHVLVNALGNWTITISPG